MALDVFADAYFAPVAVGGPGRPFGLDPHFDTADLDGFVRDHIAVATQGLGSGALVIHMPHGYDEALEDPSYPAINAPTVHELRRDHARAVISAFRAQWTGALYLYLSGYATSAVNAFNPALNAYSVAVYDASVRFARSLGCAGVLFDAALASPIATLARRHGHTLGSAFVTGSEACGTHLSPPPPEPILNVFSITGLRNYKVSPGLGAWPTAPALESWISIQAPDAPITAQERAELNALGWSGYAPTGRASVFS